MDKINQIARARNEEIFDPTFDAIIDKLHFELFSNLLSCLTLCNFFLARMIFKASYFCSRYSNFSATTFILAVALRTTFC